MSAAVAAFPRGGAPSEAAEPSATRKRKAQKGREFLFGGDEKGAKEGSSAPVKKKPRQAKGAAAGGKVATKKKTGKSNGAGLGLLAAASKEPYIKALGANAAGVGSHLLGVVANVRPEYITVALPHGVTGRLYPARVSEAVAEAGSGTDDSLSAFYEKGQVIRCVLLRKGATTHGNAALELSCRARALNRGLAPRELRSDMPLSVTLGSREDHGFVCDTGLAGVTAFLPHQGAPADLKEGQSIVTIIHGRVSSALRLRVPNAEELAAAKVTAAIRFQALQAGMLVDGVVDRHVSNGLVVSSILGAFSGTIHVSQLTYPCAASEWPAAYPVGSVITARTLVVDAANSIITLTLRPHLLRLLPAPAEPKSALGAIVEDAEVLAVTPGIGVLFGKDLPEDASPAPGDAPQDPLPEGGMPTLRPRLGFFVHISRLADHFVASAEKALSVGERRALRVVGHQLHENWATASLQASLLDAAVVRYEDCHPGLLLEGRIERVDTFGILVSIGPTLRGIVTNMHLSDVPLPRADPQRFRVGAKVAARVLVTDAAKRKLHLTLKRSLVRAKDEDLIKDWDACVKGRRANGFVTRVTPAGVTVTFFGNVHGFLPAREFRSETRPVTEVFQRGQVLQVGVGKVEQGRRPPRVFLTLNAADVSNVTLPGLFDRVGGVIASRDEKSVRIALSGKDGDSDAQGVAVLGVDMLADDAAVSRRMAALLEVGDRLEGLCVLSVRALRGEVGVTAQPLLLAAHPTDAFAVNAAKDVIPAALEQLHGGQICAGFVAGVTSAGIFVRFGEGISGLAPRSQIVGDANKFHFGDAVRVRIKSVDAAMRRVTCSFLHVDGQPASYLASHLASLSACLDGIVPMRSSPQSEVTAPCWRRYPIGSSHAALVSAARPYGLVLTFADDEGQMILVPPGCGVGNAGADGALTLPDGAHAEPGTKVSVRVMDVDGDKKVLVGSIERDVVSRGKVKHRRGLRQVEQGEHVSARVRWCSGAGYAVGELEGGELALLPAGSFSQRGLSWALGAEVRGVVARANKPELSFRKASGKVELGGSPWDGCAWVVVESDGKAAQLKRRPREEGKKKEKAKKEGGDGGEVWDIGAPVDALVVGIAEGKAEVQASSEGKRSRRGVIDALDCYGGTVQGLADLTEGARIAAYVLDASHKVLRLTTEPLSPADVAILSTQPFPAPPSLKEARKRKGRFVGVITHPDPMASPPGVHLALGGGIRAFAPVHLWRCTSVSDLKKWRQRLRPGRRCVVGAASSSKKAKGGAPSAPIEVIVHHTEEPPALRLRPWLPLPGKATASAEIAELALGQRCWGVVDVAEGDAADAPALRIWLDPSRPLRGPKGRTSFGRVCATEAADREAWTDFTGARRKLQGGEVVEAVAFGIENGRLELSLRPSRVAAARKGKMREALQDDAECVLGALAKGYVSGVVPGIGVFVRLARGATGVVKFKDLSDAFVQKPSEAFPVGKSVVARVKAVAEGGKRQLSLRASEVVAGPALAFDAVTVGMRLDGQVARVEDFGIFVRLAGGTDRLTGLAHRSEVAEESLTPEAMRERFQPGDAVRVAVLRVNAEKKQLSLSMKPSHFEAHGDDAGTEQGEARVLEAMDVEEVDEDEEEDLDVEAIMREAAELDESDVEALEEDEESDEGSDEEDDLGLEEPGAAAGDVMVVEGEKGRKHQSVEDDDDEKDDTTDPDMEDDDDEDEDEDDEDTGNMPGVGAATINSGLAMSGGFAWDDFSLAPGTAAVSGAEVSASKDHDDDDDDDEEDEDDEGEAEGTGGRSRRAREKTRQAREEEAALRRREEELLSGGGVPESAEDFERLVVARPHSSFLWIQYMAFHLSSADVEGARQLAARGLGAMPYKEEAEKANIFAAWLNLELQFGDATTLEAVLRRACDACDPKDMHLRLLGILQAAGRDDTAQDVLKKMRKKFSGDPDVVRADIGWQLARKGPESATQALQRSLQALDKRYHVEVVRHLAVALYKAKQLPGALPRAREAFEGLLEAAPKRSDLWFVWMDQELAIGEVAAARRLLERMATMRWKVRLAKQLFSKWLELEMEHGNDASAEAVKDRARAYIEDM